MQCEMCGKDANLVVAIVENVKMKVCRECGRFGNVLKQVVEPVAEKKKEKRLERKEEETVEIIVPDFPKKIRKAREKSGLDQKDFAKKVGLKESIIHKIETGHYTPSIDIAKKLEKILNISLISEYTEEKKEYKAGDSEGLTLADFIKK